MTVLADDNSPPASRRWLTVLWPAFVVAGVLEMVVFAHVDPQALHDIHGAPIELSPTAVYSIAFFVFWGLVAIAATMTQHLDRGAADINQDRGSA